MPWCRRTCGDRGARTCTAARLSHLRPAVWFQCCRNRVLSEAQSPVADALPSLPQGTATGTARPRARMTGRPAGERPTAAGDGAARRGRVSAGTRADHAPAAGETAVAAIVTLLIGDDVRPTGTGAFEPPAKTKRPAESRRKPTGYSLPSSSPEEANTDD